MLDEHLARPKSRLPTLSLCMTSRESRQEEREGREEEEEVEVVVVEKPTTLSKKG